MNTRKNQSSIPRRTMREAAIGAIVAEVEGNIGGVVTQANMSEMLESYSSFIQRLDGFGEGQLYVLSAGRFTYHETTGVEGLAELGRDLSTRGIQVKSISLATTPAPDREVMGTISTAAGGVPYDLGFLDGVIEFINMELNVQLVPSLETEASLEQDSALNIDVPPHSSYLVAGFAFEDPELNNVIEQPSGQVITGSVGSVSEFSIAG